MAKPRVNREPQTVREILLTYGVHVKRPTDAPFREGKAKVRGGGRIQTLIGRTKSQSRC